jgi:ABC-type multidrug transport system fused ATPase/permease subunit
MEPTGNHRPIMMAHEITRISSLRSILPIARELKPYLSLVILNQVICFLVLATGATVPFGLKYLTEQVMSGNMDILLWAPPIVFLLMSLLALGHMLRGLLSQYISIRISQSLQKRIFAHFLSDDIEGHSRRPVGEKMSRITFDIQWFVQGASIFLSETLFLPLVIIGCLAIMFYLSWKIALITLIVSPLGLLAGKPFSKYLRNSSMELQEHYATLSRHILDSLRGLLLIKVFAREEKENQQLDKLLDTFVGLNVKNNLWAGLFRTALAIGNALVVCLVSWGAFFLLSRTGDLSIPTLIAISSVMMFFFGEVSKFGGVMNTLTKAAVSFERIFGMLQEERVSRLEGTVRARFKEELCFEDVSFSYGNKNVLNKVSITIKRGQKIALMGMSGAGKTTFIHLMLGLLSPQQGNIRFDGTKIAEMDSVTLRNLFGYSPQLSVLFYMSVAENIAYSRPNATKQEIIEAAKIACAHDFIMALPQGYDTLVGEDGANISEGQRQRLALARSVLRDAPILVLDESSAHVDLITEKAIYENIKSLPNKTVILVSHRPSVLREADSVLSITDGQVKDIGTFDNYESTLTQKDLLKTMEFVH